MGTRRLSCVFFLGLMACGGNQPAPVRGMDGGTPVDVAVDGAPSADVATVRDPVDGPQGARDSLSSTVDGPVSARDGAVDAFDPVGACGGRYVACGCGCCGPNPGSGAVPRCYYPGEGEQLSTLMADDLAKRGDPTCANVGCSLGTLYQCCVPAAATPATYSVETYIGGIDRLAVKRNGEDGICADLVLLSPTQPDGRFRIATPDSYTVGAAGYGNCGTSMGVSAMGGIGSVSLRRAGTGCVLDVDASIFFNSASGPADSIRFQATGLPVPQLSTNWCP